MNNFSRTLVYALCLVSFSIPLALGTQEEPKKTHLSNQQVKLLAFNAAKNFSDQEQQEHRSILKKILKNPELFGTQETSKLCSTFTFFINFSIKKHYSRLHAIIDASLSLSKIMLDVDFARLKNEK